MRVVSLLLRIAGYIAIWLAIVLAFCLLTALVPRLWQLVQPPGPETYDLGLVSLVAGFIGLFINRGWERVKDSVPGPRAAPLNRQISP